MTMEKRTTRKPQQKRSKLTADKILDTALKLFCEKGYYNTTTNEIAKEAGISIGSLYSYFKDKDTIFQEILESYHQNFLSVFEHIKSDINSSLYERDKKAWLRILLDSLIELHQSVKTLNRELKALYYIKSEVQAVVDMQTEKIRIATLEILSQRPDEIHSDNLEITAILIVDFISSVVDRIVFDDELSDERRLCMIDMGVDAVYKVLYE